MNGVGINNEVSSRCVCGYLTPSSSGLKRCGNRVQAPRNLCTLHAHRGYVLQAEVEEDSRLSRAQTPPAKHSHAKSKSHDCAGRIRCGTRAGMLCQASCKQDSRCCAHHQDQDFVSLSARFVPAGSNRIFSSEDDEFALATFQVEEYSKSFMKKVNFLYRKVLGRHTRVPTRTVCVTLFVAGIALSYSTEKDISEKRRSVQRFPWTAVQVGPPTQHVEHVQLLLNCTSQGVRPRTFVCTSSTQAALFRTSIKAIQSKVHHEAAHFESIDTLELQNQLLEMLQTQRSESYPRDRGTSQSSALSPHPYYEWMLPIFEAASKRYPTRDQSCEGSVASDRTTALLSVVRQSGPKGVHFLFQRLFLNQCGRKHMSNSVAQSVNTYESWADLCVEEEADGMFWWGSARDTRNGRCIGTWGDFVAFRETVEQVGLVLTEVGLPADSVMTEMYEKAQRFCRNLRNEHTTHGTR